jgi:hypothetical protein
MKTSVTQQTAGFGAMQEYWADAWQRGVLFLDTLRERGDIYREHAAEEVPHVLDFPVELVHPLLAVETAASSWITTCLQTWGDVRDNMTEAFFLNAYGSPLLQAMVGLRAQQGPEFHRVERDFARETATAELRSDLERRYEEGGLEEALLRSLIYVRLPEGAFDERGFRMLKIIRESRKANERLSLPRFKEMFREQQQLLVIDEERAINALPKLIKAGEAEAATALDVLNRLVGARGPLDFQGKRRLARVEGLLGAKLPSGRSRKAANA